VLIGGTFVAIDRNALVDALALESSSLPSDSMMSCWR
jgi:hypothetical protein